MLLSRFRRRVSALLLSASVL